MRAGIDSQADLVVATRYADGGNRRPGVGGPGGRLQQRDPARQGRVPAAPERLHRPDERVLRRSQSRHRHDVPAAAGFKILLEIIGRSPRLRIAEVPFEFGERLSGQSKATWREGLRFARQLLALRTAASVPARMRRSATAFGFALVGLTGIVVNSAAMWSFEHLLGFSLLVGSDAGHPGLDHVELPADRPFGLWRAQKAAVVAAVPRFRPGQQRRAAGPAARARLAGSPTGHE